MKEKNIQELAKRMGLVTVEDMCQYTIAQLVVKIANKVNELVDEVWRFETDVQELLKTQNEKIQYLLGEGLHLEVGNIFDGWVQDGTFDTLLNQSALKKVNDRIDETNAQLSQNQSYISPKQTNDDIQSAIDLAVTNGVRKVVLEPKTYTVTDTILVPSNFTLEGVKGVSTIKMTNVNKPIIGKKGDIKSGTYIKNLNVSGDKSLSNNHGIILNDFWSTVEGCEVKNCGGNGIHLSSDNATGTLVENKIKDCIVRDCAGVSYSLGSENNNKLTDGYLINCISNGSGSNTALFIGSSAGWSIDGLHTYNHGGASDIITIRNAFNTNINNMYIEDFSDNCFSLTKIQRNLNLSNIIVVNSDKSTDTRIFYLNKSSSFTSQANVNISNLSVVNDIDRNVTIINGDSSWVETNVSNLSVTGNKASNIIGCADNMKVNTRIAKNINVDGKVDIRGELTSSSDKLIYGDWSQSRYKTGTFGGSSEVSFKIKIPNTFDYSRTLCKLTMYSRIFFDGDKSINYNSDIYITRKGSGTSFVMTNDLTTPTGFTTTPNYSFDVNTGELTVAFTPSNSNGEGIWRFELFN